jgi:HAD superfamily hydrolase (TIGR01490 family)
MKDHQSNNASSWLQTYMTLAIFDIDNTFVRGDSFKLFCWFAVRMNGVSLRHLSLLGFDALMYLSGRLDAGLFKASCLKALLTRCDNTALKLLTKEFLERILFKRVHTAALDHLRRHRQENHTIVFLSASPDLYLNEFGFRFGVDRTICTKFLSQDGMFSGEIYSANCKGEEKRRRLVDLYKSNEIDWSQSYGYGNSLMDVSFLEMLGNPVVVNPDRKLKQIAVERNWPVEQWG